MKVYRDQNSDEWWVEHNQTWWWGAYGYNFDDKGEIFLDIVWVPDTDSIPLQMLENGILQQSSELAFLILTGKPINLE